MIFSLECFVCNPIERSFLINRAEVGTISTDKPYALVSIATSLVTEKDFVVDKTAGLYVTHLEEGIHHDRDFACTEVDFAYTTQRGLNLDWLVALGDKGLRHHLLSLLFGALALYNDVGKIVLAADAPSTRTAQNGIVHRHGGKELLVVVG